MTFILAIIVLLIFNFGVLLVVNYLQSDDKEGFVNQVKSTAKNPQQVLRTGVEKAKNQAKNL